MTDAQQRYRECLAAEKGAWERVWASRDSDDYSIALLEWVAAGRAVALAREGANGEIAGGDDEQPPS